jgi:hypothetical protein
VAAQNDAEDENRYVIAPTSVDLINSSRLNVNMWAWPQKWMVQYQKWMAQQCVQYPLCSS